MVVQEWGCDKCSFHYGSHVRVKELEHHCPPQSRNVAKAKFLTGLPPVKGVKAQVGMSGNPPIKQLLPPEKPVGRVLRRRTSQVT